tara:strand:+ start:51 stop:368 length:318 start_codon:yes stop_codon:yes gene_type:complete
MQKCKPVEYPGNNWRCARELGGSGLLPGELKECFLTYCPGRAKLPSEIEEKAKAESKKCHQCGVVDIAPNRKRYCSDPCRKRHARAAYDERKKHELWTTKNSQRD